jgi:hypothetical protein
MFLYTKYSPLSIVFRIDLYWRSVPFGLHNCNLRQCLVTFRSEIKIADTLYNWHVDTILPGMEALRVSCALTHFEFPNYVWWMLRGSKTQRLSHAVWHLRYFYCQSHIYKEPGTHYLYMQHFSIITESVSVNVLSISVRGTKLCGTVHMTQHNLNSGWKFAENTKTVNDGCPRARDYT